MDEQVIINGYLLEYRVTCDNCGLLLKRSDGLSHSIRVEYIRIEEDGWLRDYDLDCAELLGVLEKEGEHDG